MNNKKVIEREIKKLYEVVKRKIFTKENLTLAIKDKSEIEKIAKKLQNSKQYEEFCKKHAIKIGKKSLLNERNQWKLYYEKAKSLHKTKIPNTYTEFEKSIFKKAVIENFKMIKSIPEEVMKVYKQKDVDTLIKEVLEGKLPRGSFERQLNSHNSKKAKLIARTETSKLLTAIDEQRSKDLGAVCYEWISTHDKRTRKSHQKMNGVIVFWRPDNQKPELDKMQGNAGEFPNCRCSPGVIFDESDLTKESYDVYNYKTKKIEKMSKNKLLEAIENGGL